MEVRKFLETALIGIGMVSILSFITWTKMDHSKSQISQDHNESLSNSYITSEDLNNHQKFTISDSLISFSDTLATDTSTDILIDDGEEIHSLQLTTPYSESLDKVTAVYNDNFSELVQARSNTIKKQIGVDTFQEALDYVLKLNGKLTVNEYNFKIKTGENVSNKLNPHFLLEGDTVYFSLDEKLSDAQEGKTDYDIRDALTLSNTIDELVHDVPSSNNSLSNSYERFSSQAHTASIEADIVELYVGSDLTVKEISEKISKSTNTFYSSTRISKIARAATGYSSRKVAKKSGMNIDRKDA